MGCSLTCLVILHRHKLLWGTLPYIVMWILGFGVIVSVLSCRSHYSVDVLLAIYFVYFSQNWYFSRVDAYAMCCNYSQTVVKFIAWIEDRGVIKDTPSLEVEQSQKVIA